MCVDVSWGGEIRDGPRGDCARGAGAERQGGMMDSIDYLRARVRDLGERYRDKFPQWTNRDWVHVSCLISDVADIARFKADDTRLREEDARLRTANADLRLEVARLTTENVELREAMRWRYPPEAPELGQKAIVAIDKDYLCYAEYVLQRDGDLLFLTCFGDRFGLGDITAWLPVPAAPVPVAEGAP